jgi:hypothetical protein
MIFGRVLAWYVTNSYHSEANLGAFHQVFMATRRGWSRHGGTVNASRQPQMNVDPWAVSLGDPFYLQIR